MPVETARGDGVGARGCAIGSGQAHGDGVGVEGQADRHAGTVEGQGDANGAKIAQGRKIRP